MQGQDKRTIGRDLQDKDRGDRCLIHLITADDCLLDGTKTDKDAAAPV